MAASDPARARPAGAARGPPIWPAGSPRVSERRAGVRHRASQAATGRWRPAEAPSPPMEGGDRPRRPPRSRPVDRGRGFACSPMQAAASMRSSSAGSPITTSSRASSSRPRTTASASGRSCRSLTASRCASLLPNRPARSSACWLFIGMYATATARTVHCPASGNCQVPWRTHRSLLMLARVILASERSSFSVKSGGSAPTGMLIVGPSAAKCFLPTLRT